MRSTASSEHVAAHLQRSCPRARTDETARAVLERLAHERPEVPELVLVVDAAGRLEGAVPLARLAVSDPATALGELADRNWPRVTPETDQEAAASLALHRRVDTLAVEDAAGRALGVMPSQALLQVLRREHVEDLHRLAGIQHEVSHARHAIEDPPVRRARHRMPWLLVGLAGSALATAAMAAMASRLEANVAIAFFVPALVYLADAMGTQSETIAVRGLSLTRSPLAPLLAMELRTGLLMGAMLGMIAGPLVWLFFDASLALAVAVSIVAAGTAANAIGLVLPWLLMRFGLDPAYGTGPAGTVLSDICTIGVYFAVVSALL